MTQIFKAVLLGFVQGVTEFLPVSSTGHLILLEKFFGISQDVYGLTFDTVLHVGTLVALLWFFSKEWSKLIPAGISILKTRSIGTNHEKLISLLLLATVPGAVFGLLLEKKVETVFRSPLLVSVTLILFSLILIYVEKLGKKKKLMQEMSFVDSVLIGLAQAIALIPGVSRSGITIATGMWRELRREEAARFAFLLSAPIIAGAGAKKLLDVFDLYLTHQLPGSELLFYAVGMVSSALFGYVTIKYFLRYLSCHSLWIFIWYRILLGLVVLGIFFLQ